MAHFFSSEMVDWADDTEGEFQLVGRESALVPSDSALQEPTPAVPETKASKGLQVERHWEEILSSNYQLQDQYIFDEIPFSTRPMTHEFRLSPLSHLDHDDFFGYIDQVDQDAIIAAFVKKMCHWGVFETTPVITFNGRMMLVTCSTQSVLAASWKILSSSAGSTLANYNLEPMCKGLPFIPRFWLLEGVPANANRKVVMDKLQSYCNRNQVYLGKIQVAYASFYRVVRQGSKAVFSGNALIVTDALTIRAKSPTVMPGFYDARPVRVKKPKPLM
ncbi:uncharacterized protein UTRI_10419_B [Ustilago trichophora]|uniref:Uncharacterized protein n=1 Tax=Ustilago trichophora TaxID=86804 RepID=A0A5C3E9U4_9BASI|nr:uncharacterized protein UTRI_10419_B [Ustilago trichophora]